MNPVVERWRQFFQELNVESVVQPKVTTPSGETLYPDLYIPAWDKYIVWMPLTSEVDLGFWILGRLVAEMQAGVILLRGVPWPLKYQAILFVPIIDPEDPDAAGVSRPQSNYHGTLAYSPDTGEMYIGLTNRLLVRSKTPEEALSLGEIIPLNWPIVSDGTPNGHKVLVKNLMTGEAMQVPNQVELIRHATPESMSKLSSDNVLAKAYLAASGL